MFVFPMYNSRAAGKMKGSKRKKNAKSFFIARSLKNLEGGGKQMFFVFLRKKLN